MSSVTMNFGETETLESMREPNAVAPGIFHFYVSNVEDLISEQSQENYGVKVTLQVLAGNVAGQEKKVLTESFNFPNSTHKDGGAFCAKRLKMLCKASGLVKPDHVGPMEVPFGQLIDMQLIAEVHERKWENKDRGTSGVQSELRGLNMWHIDEPCVANIPKNPKAIENACGHRWTPEMIAAAAAKLQEGGKGTDAGATVGAAATPSGKPKPDWSNI